MADENVGQQFIKLYHHTTSERAGRIMEGGRMHGGYYREVYASTNPDDRNASGYGSAVVEINAPSSAVRLDDEFPDGSQHYAVKPESVQPIRAWTDRRAYREMGQ